MNDPQRIMARIAGIIFILVGIYVLLTADLEQDKNSLYRVTTYRARTGTLVSDKIMEGRDIIKNKRLGGAFCIALGGFCVWLCRPPNTGNPSSRPKF